jgi:hypothetical protein
MFGIDQAPRYVEEAALGAVRLQERTTPSQYEALRGRAERLLDGLLRVETGVPPEVQVKIALREKFDAARTKQAILTVATWGLLRGLGASKDVRCAPSARRHPRPAAPAPDPVLATAMR